MVDESVVSTTVTKAFGGGNRFSFLRSQSRNWLAVALYSAALLIPCFWQSRIQSADLPSHIYNVWLASLIRKGSAPGLWISFQSNNVLFDVILEWLLSRVGAAWAQRFAVSVSVLVFAWGAILFTLRFASRLASGNADRESWAIAVPCVAMLTYGFIFHMGFFNFYLSMGLCLCYFAISWARERSWQIRVLAAPLLIGAWIAHPFPVVWAVASAVYIAAAGGLTPSRRGFLVALGLAALIAARYILTHRYSTLWSWRQLFFVTGANQVELFGLKYALPFAGLLSIWWLLLRSLVKKIGLMHLITAIPFQLWLLNAAAVLLIPDRVMFPQFGRPFGYITDRLSLGTGLMMCAIVAAAPSTRVLRAALISVTVLFFGLLYADNRELNQLEDRLDATVARMPPGQRVLSSLSSDSLRSLCLQHDLERACLGHCFSYANYEPSSRQFRVRARPGNGLVLADYADVNAVADGSYIVLARDLPVYLVYPCGPRLRDVCSRPLQAGEAIGKQK